MRRKARTTWRQRYRYARYWDHGPLGAAVLAIGVTWFVTAGIISGIMIIVWATVRLMVIGG